MPALIAKPAHKEFYCREDMALFNALEHPVYVFDILNKSIWWANTEAVKMWNADCLESLLERDFASDMSEASEKRMLDYLRRFEKGERARESWYENSFVDSNSFLFNAKLEDVY